MQDLGQRYRRKNAMVQSDSRFEMGGPFTGTARYPGTGLAVSCLARCGFLLCFDLNFNFGSLFQASFLAFLIRQRVLNPNLPI